MHITLGLPVFRQAVEALKDLTTEVSFDVDPEAGLSLQVMDSSHVCLVALAFPPAALESFACDVPRALAVNVAHLNKILRCGRAEDATLTMEADPEPADRLHVSFGDACFDMRLLNLEGGDRLQVPEADDADAIRVTMASAEYARLFRDLAGLGMDAARFDVSDEGLTLSAEGDGVSVRIKLKADAPEECAEPWGVSVALRYMATFARPGMAPAVIVTLSRDMPVRVAYEFGEGAGMSFFLAPKVEDDDGGEIAGDNA